MSQTSDPSNQNRARKDRRRVTHERRRSLDLLGRLEGSNSSLSSVVQQLEERTLLSQVPTITITNGSLVTTSGSIVPIIPSTATVSISVDPSLEVSSSTITISNVPDASSETLSVVSSATFPAGINFPTSQYDSTAKTVSVTLTAATNSGVTPAAMEMALQDVGYADGAAGSTAVPGLRSIAIKVTDTAMTTSTPANSATAQVGLTVTPPTLSLGTQSQFGAVGAVPIIPSAANNTLTAGDLIASATLTVSSAQPDGTNEGFVFSPTADAGKISVTGNSPTNPTKLTLASTGGPLPAADFLTALESIDYNDTQPTLGLATRTFSVVVTDASTPAQVGTGTSILDYVSDSTPTVSLPTIAPFSENSPITINGITIGDPNQNPNVTETVIVSVARGTLTLASGQTSDNNKTSGSTLTFTNKTPAAITAALANLQYLATVGSSQSNASHNDFLTVSVTQAANFFGIGGPTHLNNQQATLPVEPIADLSVVVTTQTTPDEVKSPVTYSFTITNNGPDLADNVSISNLFSLLNATAGPLTASTPTLVSSSVAGQGLSSTVINGLISFTFSQPFGLRDVAVVSVIVTPLASGQLKSVATPSLSETQDAAGNKVTNPPAVTVTDHGTLSISTTQAILPVGPQSPTPVSYPVVHVSRTPLPGDNGDGTVIATITLGDATHYGTGNGDFTITLPGSSTALNLTSLNNTFQVTFNPGEVDKVLTINVYGSNDLGSNLSFNLAVISETGGASIDTAHASVTETLQNTNTLVVTTTQNNVTGSIQQILAFAQLFEGASPYPVPITFNIPASQGTEINGQTVFDIALDKALPINTEVFIDGRTQVGINPLIEFTQAYTGSAAGITFGSGSAGSTLRSVEVANFSGDGIDIDADKVTIEQSTILGNGGYGIDVEGFQSDTILGNTIKGSTIGVLVDGAKLAVVASNTITEPTVTPAGTMASLLVVGIAVGGNASASQISANTITGGNVTAMGPISGGSFSISLSGISVGNSSDITISGNSINGEPGSASVTVFGGSASVTVSGISVGGSATDATVTANSVIGGSVSLLGTIAGATAEDVGILVAGSAMGTTVGGNSIAASPATSTVSNATLEVTLPGPFDGVLVGGSATWTTISGNTIGESTISGLAAGVTAIAISGTGPSDGILVNGSSTSTSIIGNNITGLSVTVANAGATKTAITSISVSESFVGVSLEAVSGTIVRGNVVDVFGVSPNATQPVPVVILNGTGDGNILEGVYVIGGTGNLIDANSISGNFTDGIEASGGQSTPATSQTNFLQAQDNTISGTSASSVGISFHDLSRFDDNQTIGIVGNEVINLGGVGIEIANTEVPIVVANLIGTDSANDALGNKLDGMILSYSPGAEVFNNTIEFNGMNGLEVTGSGANDLTVSGNMISSNQLDGVWMHDVAAATKAGQTTQFIRNTITQNKHGFGLEIDSSSVSSNLLPVLTVVGNFIGTDSSNTASIGNGRAGVKITSSDNAVIAYNVISGNLATGLHLIDSNSVTINTNIVGLGVKGTNPIGNAFGGIWVENSAGALIESNEIAENGGDAPAMAGYGLKVDDTSSSITILDNRIGTDAGATLARGNFGDGILILGVPSVKVLGNFIAANANIGLEVDDADSPLIQSNIIGQGASLQALGNGNDGVLLTDTTNAQVSHNTIANDRAAGIALQFGSNAASVASNIITSNGDGVSLFASSMDLIGNNALVNNLQDGIDADNASSLTVSMNVVESNRNDGILVSGTPDGVSISGEAVKAENITVSGNTIGGSGINGVEVARTVDGMNLTSNTIGGTSPNQLDGVLISAKPTSNPTQSVTVKLDSNIVSYNGNDGVQLAGAQGVRIATGNTIDNNDFSGVDLGGSTYNLIGTLNGSVAGDNNQISGNIAYGIKFDGSSSYNTVMHPAISNNQSDGIQITNGSSYNTISGAIVWNNFGNGIDILSVPTTMPAAPDIDAVNLIDSTTIGLNHNNGILIDGGGAASNLVRGNNITTNSNNGISVLNSGAGNQVDHDTISVNSTFGLSIVKTRGSIVQSSAILLNNSFGLSIDESDGSMVLSNDISSNASNGVVITNASSGNVLLSNMIDSNKLSGVLLLGVSGNFVGEYGHGNTITKNSTDAVSIFLPPPGGTTSSPGNAVLGNFIGTDAFNDPAMGNSGDGIHLINSNANTIGGNTISSNLQSGVEIFGNSANNLVSGNFIGAARADETLDNKLDGVLISGSVAKGTDPATTPTGNRIYNNQISGNESNGIVINLASGNGVVGNYIGGLSAGSETNALSGVGISSSSNTTVADNVITANGVDGIGLDASSLTAIYGNLIQTNDGDGVRVQDDSSSNLVGVYLPGVAVPPNRIVGNVGAGVEISTGSFNNRLQNNQIGFLADGLIQGNTFGVLLNQVSGNTVGGASLGGANVITGNSVYGVYVSGNALNNVFGNTIQDNLVGTDPIGNSPNAFSSTNIDVGIQVINSQVNQISGNVVSGNHTAGIELFGELSTGNQIDGNTVGSTYDTTKAVLTQPTAENFYSASNRQTYGILINGATSNFVGANAPNNVLGNLYGIYVKGAASTSNLVVNNYVGPQSLPTPFVNSAGLGNVNGIYISNASSTTVNGNHVVNNLEAGVSIVGGAASGNLVQHNWIESNGGYSTYDPATLIYQVTPPADHEPILIGTGVYIEGSMQNTIGVPVSPLGAVSATQAMINADQNFIENNMVAGVYVYNFGTLSMTGADATGKTTPIYNSIAGNMIVGADSANNPGKKVYIGEYGVLLYDSSGNIPGVALSGYGSNTISGTSLAPFHEYTGPGPDQGVILQVSGGSLFSAASVSVKAASVSPPVTVTTGGKGHPRAPVHKGHSRKS